MTPEYIAAIAVLITAVSGLVFGLVSLVTTSRRLHRLDGTINETNNGIKEVHIIVNSQRELMEEKIEDLRTLVNRLVLERELRNQKETDNDT